MQLSWQALDAISKHALADYPSECCGIVTGDRFVQRVYPLVNIQDRLHADDPEAHPRDSRTAYAVDRAEIDQIIGRNAGNGDPVLVFYHSHIDCDAYFSKMDREVQTILGEPEFPDALHVVVSVMKGNLWCIKGYIWDGKTRDFVEIEIR